MSGEGAGIQMYSVAHKGLLDEEAVPTGVVAIDDEQFVDVKSAEGAFADDLDLAASMLNAGDNFLVDEDPSPDDPRFEICKRAVPRGASEARAALLDVLRETYHFELTPLN
jgi:hypothetical protein